MARYWEWEDPFKSNPEETALLIVDMQKGFTQESGPLFTPQCKEQLPVIADLKKFCNEKNIPVFIIIGIGGSPSKPSEIFVIPLASIKYVELPKSWLENYRHDPTKNMFFDVPTKTLR